MCGFERDTLLALRDAVASMQEDVHRASGHWASEAKDYLERDCTLWAWGDNESGEVGLSDVPKQFGSDSDWVAVVASAASFGIKRDGTL